MYNKPIIENSIKTGQLLEFEVVFPNEQPLSPEEYLRGGSKRFILDIATFFLGFKQHHSKYADNKEFLSMFFQQENQTFAQTVYDKIRTLERKDVRIGIINPYSSLRLFECFFLRPSEPETQSQAVFEINLFKAYLVLNSTYTKVQFNAIKSTRILDGLFKIQMQLFCMHYPISDKLDFDIKEIWLSQSIKSIYLFQYLESNKGTQHLLTVFLTHFNSRSWQDYLRRLLSLTTSAITNEKEAQTDIIVTHDENFKEDCIFIEKFIIRESDEINGYDFINLRYTPFYKIKDGVYRIIYNLFVVEKIFKGIYFILRDINNTLPIEQKIPNLKSIYGHEFSEKTLLYQIIDTIYPDKCIKYSGQQLADMSIDGAPDYYIRKGKQILLFESKDFLISADLKSSFDYSIYEKEFSKTLYFKNNSKGKVKAGAVMQLISNIKKLLKNEFPADNSYHYRDVSIYPILITHDLQYDTPGFSNLINKWFIDELEELRNEGYFTNRIKPLSVINIDALVFHQLGLSENVPLHEVLDKYYDYTKFNGGFKPQSIEDVMSKMISFSLFISNFFKKLEIRKIPPIIELVAPHLFEEELDQNTIQINTPR